MQKQDIVSTLPPIVAIVGRPNVGKSTLFNRLVGKKIAITDSIPGSTRDIIEKYININGVQFILADTSGRRDAESNTLESLAIKRSFSIDEKAHLLLFIIEATQLSAEDEQLIKYLRRYHHKVILVVNKCDSPERELVASNYYKLGFKKVVTISAEHGHNIDLLKDSILDELLLYPKLEEVALNNQEPIRITILGKPNSGKSTLANQLTQTDKSLVSEEAGTTRDSIKSIFTYNNQLFEIIDTAGLRKKSKVNEPIEFYATRRVEQSIAEADIAILLIDANLGLTDQDKKIADKIIKEQKPFLFVLNKCDLLNNNSEYSSYRGDKTKLAIQNLQDNFPVLNYLVVICIQAEHNIGLDKLMKHIMIIYEQNRKLIDDREFQRALPQWQHDLETRTIYKKNKIRSIRQISSQPPKFVVKAQGKIPNNYIRYLNNRIKREFGFNLIPIVVEVEGV